MQIQLGGASFFYGVAIIIGLFSAVLLLLINANRKANRFLALLLVFSSLWLIDAFFNASSIYAQYPDFYFKPIYYSFAFGPLIYFYVKSLVSKDFHFRKSDWLHFIPAVLQGILYWVLTFQSYEFKRWFWFDIHQPITYRIEFDGTFLSLMIYMFLSIQLVRVYQSWVKENYSEVSRLNLQWLKVVLALLIIWSTQWLFEVILREFFDSYYDYYFSMLILGVLVIILAVGGILQDNLSQLGFVPSVEDSNLIPSIDQILLQTIKNEMETKQSYLNPTLTLKQFAQEIDIPKRTISEHLNHGLEKSFIDFVNHYRVEEVKRRLSIGDQERYSLQGIAMESGFRSKATFYRVFKQLTGQSPSEYLQQ
jgi:AraC-like DNA-binding protein